MDTALNLNYKLKKLQKKLEYYQGKVTRFVRSRVAWLLVQIERLSFFIESLSTKKRGKKMTTKPTQEEKELKKQLKALCKELKEKGAPGYISLSIASLDQLKEYYESNKNWSPRAEPEPEPEIKEIRSAQPILDKIPQQTHLSKLGKVLSELSGLGEWKHWEIKLWTKNGQCRLYLTDISYRNPKDRGYALVSSEGKVSYHFNLPNITFPDFPPLPTTVDDLAIFPARTSTEIAERILKAGEAKRLMEMNSEARQYVIADYDDDEWHFGADSEEGF
jgi:hypothetical protein